MAQPVGSLIQAQIRKRLQAPEGAFELDVALEIPAHAFFTLFGKSGAGKTTLLRLLAGLATPDAGWIRVNGQAWFDAKTKTNLSPQKREIGFVFQDYALFPNMTVRENLEYAAADKDAPLLAELLGIMELTALQDRKPGMLSGGQQQRVALARAVARRPRILLLDEPLAALDLDTRLHLQDEVFRLHQHFGLTTILVTHDLAEVFKLSTQVLLMESGRIVASGNPENIFLEKKVSGKFRLPGEILSIQKNDVIYVVTVAAGNNIVKVVATHDELRDLKVGDHVVVVSKAFNPVILKSAR